MDDTAQRELICALGRRMWEKGWVAANDGNLSVRLAPGRFLVTPAGVSKGFLTPEMLLAVDETGAVLEGDPRWRPSSETPLHLRCYRERADVNGVCHAHPPAATAFACARQGILAPILGEIVMTLGEVPCAPYARTGTQALPEAAAPFLRKYDAVLLSNHGALTVADSLENAYWRMETVEHTARIHLNVRALGGGVPLSADEIASLRQGG